MTASGVAAVSASGLPNRLPGRRAEPAGRVERGAQHAGERYVDEEAARYGRVEYVAPEPAVDFLGHEHREGHADGDNPQRHGRRHRQREQGPGDQHRLADLAALLLLEQVFDQNTDAKADSEGRPARAGRTARPPAPRSAPERTARASS